MAFILIALVALLAFANGSNDNSKGVATLVGFGAARPFAALVYATLATAAGGAISYFVAGGLLKGFSGGFLFTRGINLDQHFYVAVLIGACGWVLLATRTGMPVSTTHAIVGALTGAGLVAFGNARFQWNALGDKFALPLAVSPVLSLAIVYVIAWPVVAIVSALAGRRRIVREQRIVQAVAVGAEGVISESIAETTQTMTPVSPTANAIHWLSCGLISFARGWNDTPKIAALSLLALASVAHGTAIGFVIVTISMAAGGLIMGRRVLETLAKKLTPLPLAESLTASLVTAFLVGFASEISLPVSTTQVATGSIIGAGLKRDPAGVKWGKVGEVVLSWIITLPVAAAIAAVAKLALR
ncbi:MAG TPA: anion permease [Tepidisphaeraceae bacterium]|nr:anion permease [Tepidisphaeraceae bacterium]